MEYFEKILNNIKILDVTYYEEMFCIVINIKIEDNNKKHFNKKTLRKEVLVINNVSDIDKAIRRAIRDYIYKKYPVEKYENEKIFNEWREKYKNEQFK